MRSLASSDEGQVKNRIWIAVEVERATARVEGKEEENKRAAVNGFKSG